MGASKDYALGAPIIEWRLGEVKSLNMQHTDRHGWGTLRQRCLLWAAAIGLAVLAFGLLGSGPSRASGRGALERHALGPRADAFATTVDYVVRFYPLWFTYNQTQNGTY